MSNYRGKRISSKSSELGLDEVEELLRATEDAMVLKLSVDAHHTSRTTSSSSSSPLDDDLIRRFEALKAPSVSDKITSVPSRSREEKKDGDVFARFSDLKGGSSVESNGSEMVGKEEDEVEKLIQWAVDAARLDPSLSGDEEKEEADDDDDDDASSDIDDDDDDEEEEEEDVKKKQSKNKKKKKEEKPVK